MSTRQNHHPHPAKDQSKKVSFSLPVDSYTHGTPWGFNSLIAVHPGISQVDKTTLTLANTLAYLDGDAGFPRSLLMRAGRSQRRWGSDGEPKEVSPEEANIASDLVEVLSSVDYLQTAIVQLCFQRSLFSTACSASGDFDVFMMDPGTRAMYKQSSLSTPQHGMLQALLLVCHAFPVDVHLDPDFRELASAYVPQLQHVITQYYDSLQALGFLTNDMRRNVAYTLVHSSLSSSKEWWSEALERAEKIAANLITPDRCLDMMIMIQKINKTPSIQKKIDSINSGSGSFQGSKQFNAQFGQACLTWSNMHRRNKQDIEAAYSCLQKIRPIDQNHISTMEELILQQKALSWGRLLRFEGRFEDALSLLEDVYDARHYPEGVVSVGESDCELLSQLAELHCELGSPGEAEMLVSAKLESIFEKTRNNTKLGQYKNDILKLLFAQAEAALQQGEYWRAFDLYRDMNRYIWSTRGRHNWVRAVCRLHMGFARVHHLQGEWAFALKYWERAMHMYEKHQDTRDFGAVVTYASIACVKLRLSKMDEARSFAIKSQELFEITGRQYWYTGLASWYDEMLLELKDL